MESYSQCIASCCSCCIASSHTIHSSSCCYWSAGYGRYTNSTSQPTSPRLLLHVGTHSSAMLQLRC